MPVTTAPLDALPLPPLDPERAVARGSERLVFEWPARPDILLKQTLPGARGARAAGSDPLFRREWRSWRRAEKFAARTGRSPPVAEVIDRRTTPEGSVHVVRKVADASGGMGPSLEALAARGGLSDETLALLNRHVADLSDAGIVVHDARAANFVLETGPGGEARFVLVDGFGDRAFVPLRAWIPALARRRLARALQRTARETGLRFDATGRRFVRPE